MNEKEKDEFLNVQFIVLLTTYFTQDTHKYNPVIAFPFNIL